VGLGVHMGRRRRASHGRGRRAPGSHASAWWPLSRGRVCRQSQAVTAGRRAMQKVAADVVSVLVHPPQRVVGPGPGRSTRLSTSSHQAATAARRAGRGAVYLGHRRCTWAAVSAGHSSAGAVCSATGRVGAGRYVCTCQRVPRWCGPGHATWREGGADAGVGRVPRGACRTHVEVAAKHAPMDDLTTCASDVGATSPSWLDLRQ
jgi:hypothetical protein